MHCPCDARLCYCLTPDPGPLREFVRPGETFQEAFARFSKAVTEAFEEIGKGLEPLFQVWQEQEDEKAVRAHAGPPPPPKPVRALAPQRVPTAYRRAARGPRGAR